MLPQMHLCLHGCSTNGALTTPVGYGSHDLSLKRCCFWLVLILKIYACQFSARNLVSGNLKLFKRQLTSLLLSVFTQTSVIIGMVKISKKKLNRRKNRPLISHFPALIKFKIDYGLLCEADCCSTLQFLFQKKTKKRSVVSLSLFPQQFSGVHYHG